MSVVHHPRTKDRMMNNDPCKGCAVYREIGCAHVDGYLCDFPTCDILVEYLEDKQEGVNDESKTKE